MTLVDECFPRGGKPKIQQAQGGKPRGVVPKKKNDALFKVVLFYYHAVSVSMKPSKHDHHPLWVDGWGLVSMS